MTDLNNSNGGEKQPGDSRKDDQNSTSWDDFLAEHASDLGDVEHSRTAKKFNKQAEKMEKQALLNVQDLKQNAFVGGNSFSQPGPRDHTGNSWLDTDDVMDQYGDDFTPPNPKLGHVNAGRVVLWVLLLVGVAGLIVSTLMPSLASILGVIFGLCFIIGLGGLFVTHRGHDDTKDDWQDDGARV